MGGGPRSAGWVYPASQILILWSGTHSSRFDPSSSGSRESGAGAPTQKFLTILSARSSGFCLHSEIMSALGKGLGKVSWPTWFSDPCFKGNLTQNLNKESKHREPLVPPLQCVKSGLSVRLSIWGKKKPRSLLLTTCSRLAPPSPRAPRQVNSWQSWEGLSSERPRAGEAGP